MSVSIREALSGDRERLVDLMLQLNRSENAIEANRRTDRAGAEDSLQAAEEQVAKTDGFILVAEVEGRVGGFLTLTFEEGPVYVVPEARPYAHIGDLAVDESLRRRGIGRALMTAAEAAAAKRGYRELVIGVLSGNTAAEAAYRNQGYRDLGLSLIKRIAPAAQSGD